MAERLGPLSHGYEKYPYDLKVMALNPGRVELFNV